MKLRMHHPTAHGTQQEMRVLSYVPLWLHGLLDQQTLANQLQHGCQAKSRMRLRLIPLDAEPDDFPFQLPNALTLTSNTLTQLRDSTRATSSLLSWLLRSELSHPVSCCCQQHHVKPLLKPAASGKDGEGSNGSN